MKEKTATWMGIIGNSLLFTAKIIVGMLYNSIAIISDALNSFTDIIASIIVHFSVVVSYRGVDDEHQFGHKRAQPIAGLIVAIFTGIVGFEVITAAATRLMNGEQIEKGIIPMILLLCVMASKALMYFYTKSVIRQTKSAALAASAVDHRNDIVVSLAVLAGVAASNFGYPVLDPLVALIIGVYIIKSGYSVGRDNIKYLMGDAPPERLFEKIRKTAKSVKGVRVLNDVRAHYVGTLIEAEVHINVDRKIDVETAHGIGKKVQRKLEEMDEISRAFIHIDPFYGEAVKEKGI